MRLTVVANCPLPYHTPVLNELADLVDLHVIYMSRDHPGRRGGATWDGFDNGWGDEPQFKFEFSWSGVITVPKLDFRAQYSGGISRRLRLTRPDVVLGSGWGPLMFEPVVWARATGRRSIMWAESSLRSGLFRGPVSNAFRRLLISQVDAFVTNGTAATQYLGVLGVPEGRIVTSRLPSSLVPSQKVIHSMSRGAGKTYLFIGRLVPRKRVEDAIRAFTRVLAHEPDARLIIVGAGPREGALRQAIAPLQGKVEFVGRREGPQLSQTFATADVLLVPSEREVWGLVVNEGLAHGLHIIASNEVEAAVDLITPSTGSVIPVRDIDALAHAMVAAPVATAESRARATASVAAITPRGFAEDIVRAAEIAIR